MIYLILLLVSYSFMEFVAWFSHKYVMHGFGWPFHKDHHITPKNEQGFFEKNDIFFVIYALPAIVLITSGLFRNNLYMISVGTGITLYGFTYFLIHDVLIHHRLPVNITFKKGYFRALVRAHKAHHNGKDVRDFKNYGLLVFPVRFFKE